MLDRYILVSHLFRLILCMDEDIVEILTNVSLAALNFRPLTDRLLHRVDEELALDAHLFKQF